MFNSLWPHGLQQARLLCPPLSPRVGSDSCPLSLWYYLTISSSAHPSPFAFNLSQHQALFQWVFSFTSGGHSIGVSASVLPIQGWLPLGWTGLTSLQFKGLSRIFSRTTIWKHQFFGAQLQLSHPYMITGKTIALTTKTFVGKVISLLFFTYLCREVIIFFSFHMIKNRLTPRWQCNKEYYFYLFIYFLSWIFLLFLGYILFFSFIFISWRLIILQYCIGFCHTLTWISHGFTCVPHPEPPSHLPPHPLPLGHPSAPAPSTCLIHPTWTGDLFHTW